MFTPCNLKRTSIIARNDEGAASSLRRSVPATLNETMFDEQMASLGLEIEE
jgi:hypothetical protein